MYRGLDIFWPGRIGRLDLEAAVRACICVLVPLLVLWSLDELQLAAYASFAAFTGLYGRTERYRQRAVSVAVAAVALLVTILAGMGTALVANHDVLFVIVLVLICGLGVVLSAVMHWIPSGSVFLVFAYSVCSAIPTSGADLVPRMSLAVAVAGFAWLVAMSGWLVRRTVGKATVALQPLREVSKRDGSACKDPVVLRVALETGLGAGLALLLSGWLGLGHAYWAAVAVAATVPRPHAPRVFTRAIHRVAGTGIGVLVTALFLSLDPTPLSIVLVAALCQFLAELIVGQVYWIALIFVTPLALSVSSLSVPAATSSLVADRLLDTLLGGVVAGLLIWLGSVRTALSRDIRDR
ncbi:FUSC family protein [Saxibacter everestensis]|uniref:FUSC family protein n=1 Tax=Saxibacter everestensis TaxID=2909229 RepID=A0ABY8QZN0_9MICO|nr:FUSC family protein [Brevibacteriaceae bacterium ZFBP1038]